VSGGSQAPWLRSSPAGGALAPGESLESAARAAAGGATVRERRKHGARGAQTTEPEPTTPTTPTTPTDENGDEEDVTIDVPGGGDEPAPEPSAAAPAADSGGGSLPATGFAVLFIALSGMLFVVVGRRLRPSARA
jgi:hypothetical protein